MKKIIYIFLFASLSIFTQAQSPNLGVGGTISREDATALEGAMVTVLQDGKEFTSFLTSSNGTYFLYLAMGSEYNVSVTKKGYAKKYFTVSTLGVKDKAERKKFSVMTADLELIEHVPDVDYSLLDQPMNRYFYNPKTDDFEYDDMYLKDMLAGLKKLKADKKHSIKLAQQKADKNKKADLAKQKATEDEKLAAEKKAKAKEAEANTAVVKNNPTATQKILSADALILNTNGQDATAIMAKYPPGVTEEVINGAHVLVVQRILVVKDKNAWVYHKKIFDWGGVACFRDGKPITESVFEAETKKSI